MICYKIIETHQGKIFIKSEMNKGLQLKSLSYLYTSKLRYSLTEIFKTIQNVMPMLLNEIIKRRTLVNVPYRIDT